MIVSDDPSISQQFQQHFQHNAKVDCAPDKETCLHRFKPNRYELIFIDLDILRSPATKSIADYKKDIQPLWQTFPSAEIIVLTHAEMIREAVKAVKAGLGNYLTYPINPDELKYVMESLYESKQMQYELDYLRDRFWQSDSLELVHTNSPLMKEVFEKVKAAAPTKITVLLIGETGTGKGVIARLLHRHSQRSQNQFIAVHCGAIPENLIESELFGHEKGSFTGAVRRRLGKFEIAQKGTIFLDEVGTISPATQIKLLQVLQDHTFQRVGGEEMLNTDVRVVAATNIDLKVLCDKGDFRPDLFYRLNVFPIEIPPLRHRGEDIPLLIDMFLKKLNKFHLKEIHGVHPTVLDAFQRYSWPGNIRELENIMERAFILETQSILMPERFPLEIFHDQSSHTSLKINPTLPLAKARQIVIEQFEKAYLKDLLKHYHGRINQTAEASGITTRQLHKLLTKYGIHKEEFK